MDIINSILTMITDLITLIFDTFDTVLESLTMFYDMLQQFNDTIVQMAVNPSGGTGLPVVQSIGLVRYLVGDVVFYFIYMMVLFGCLATIYRLVILLIEAKDAIVSQSIGGAGGSGAITSLISKFLK